MKDLPEYLTEAYLRELVDRALQEDVGDGDVTTIATIPPGTMTSGALLCKQDGVVAGVTVATTVFRSLDPDITLAWSVDEGDAITKGQRVATISGPAHGVLVGERTALNLLQRMSGIATETSRMVSIARQHGAEIMDTRKTVPGLRLLDKWAVKIGGGRNHRIGLFDMLLVKDNHIAVAGGLRPAIHAAVAFAERYPRSLEIEVEVRTLEELQEALSVGGVDVLLLDNMVTIDSEGIVDTSMLERAVREVNGAVRTEASGNVTRSSVGPIAATGVNLISCGALTHSVAALDLSLKLDFS